MSNFVKKISNNYEAADLLIERKFFSSSIHCSYYSSFQVLLLLIDDQLKSEWQNFQDAKTSEFLNNKSAKKEDSHNLTISFIKENIIKTNSDLGRLFSKEIGILKKNRHTSDYKNVEIGEKIATDSQVLATSINLELFKHYNIK